MKNNPCHRLCNSHYATTTALCLIRARSCDRRHHNVARAILLQLLLDVCVSLRSFSVCDEYLVMNTRVKNGNKLINSQLKMCLCCLSLIRISIADFLSEQVFVYLNLFNIIRTHDNTSHSATFFSTQAMPSTFLQYV